MLTKTDLNQIRKVVKEEIGVQLDPVQINLRSEIRSTRADFHSEIQLFRNDLHKEILTLDQSIKRVQRKLDKVVDFFDHKHVGLVKRVERLENHLNLPLGFLVVSPLILL